ncbi:MAG: DUF3098 domain-containing protein [Duncaniella sp.]|nr:DUF3098 domain-containing protein [Duncaniella sp.]MDE5954303.1 DUF3098 domain-containing protein [Duncaniella sp.]
MAYNTAPKRDEDESRLLKENESSLPLLKTNFILMAIAGILIVAGFCLMAGGATDWDAFNPDIFSTRRIVVGPSIAFIGFIFMGFAIMYSPKGKEKND